MGADLVVAISQGPRKIGGKGPRALRHANQVIKFARKVLELQERNDFTPKAQRVLDEAFRTGLLKEFAEEEQIDDFSDAEGYIESIASSNAEVEVRNFIDWWNSGSGRDTSWAFDAFEPKRKIVVCGDTTWGDSPDGFGYSTLRRARWFGIPQRLGVR